MGLYPGVKGVVAVASGSVSASGGCCWVPVVRKCLEPMLGFRVLAMHGKAEGVSGYGEEFWGWRSS